MHHLVCRMRLSRFLQNAFSLSPALAKMPKHHLMVGTWTRPGAIFTFEFDDEALTLKLIKRSEIPHHEPISWMTFSVGCHAPQPCKSLLIFSCHGP